MKSDKASFVKTIDIIRSCKTKKQLNVAIKYVSLACNFCDENWFDYHYAIKVKGKELMNASVVERNTR